MRVTEHMYKSYLTFVPLCQLSESRPKYSTESVVPRAVTPPIKIREP